MIVEIEIFKSPAQGVIPLSPLILSTISGRLARMHPMERYGWKRKDVMYSSIADARSSTFKLLSLSFYLCSTSSAIAANYMTTNLGGIDLS